MLRSRHSPAPRLGTPTRRVAARRGAERRLVRVEAVRSRLGAENQDRGPLNQTHAALWGGGQACGTICAERHSAVISPALHQGSPAPSQRADFFVAGFVACDTPVGGSRRTSATCCGSYR